MTNYCTSKESQKSLSDVHSVFLKIHHGVDMIQTFTQRSKILYREAGVRERSIDRLMQIRKKVALPLTETCPMSSL